MKEMENEIINPALMLAISRMKENNNLITQNKMIGEALNAKFLVPGIMRFKPGTEREQKRTSENTMLNFSMLKNPEGVMYFVAFTDMGEFEKWKVKAGQTMAILVMTFDEIADLIRKSGDQSNGFVLNPATSKVTFQKNIVLSVIENRDRAIAEGKIKKVTSEEAFNPDLESDKGEGEA